jgi:hypothetical protein
MSPLAYRWLGLACIAAADIVVYGVIYLTWRLIV